jgi:hypothetical protein
MPTQSRGHGTRRTLDGLRQGRVLSLMRPAEELLKERRSELRDNWGYDGWRPPVSAPVPGSIAPCLKRLFAGTSRIETVSVQRMRIKWDRC